MSNVLTVLNLAFGLAIFGINIAFYRQCRADWRWVKLLYAILGLLYTGLYVMILFNAVPAQYGMAFMANIVRPLITLTLGTILAGSILTARRRGGDEC